MITYLCKFVLASELLQDTSLEFQEEFQEELGKKVGWGDLNRAMIDFDLVKDVFSLIENDDSYSKFSNVLRSRIEAAQQGGAEYVDLEN